jgi:hypothetical protein
MLYWALVLYAYVYPAHTDYVPRELWQELTSRFLTEITMHDGEFRFRGSLVDDKMYAIDVNEWRLDDILSEYRERAPRLQNEACVSNGLPCDQSKL